MSWRDDLDKHAGAWGFYKLAENEVTEVEFDFTNAKVRPSTQNWPEMHCKVRVDADLEWLDARLEFWSLSSVNKLAKKHESDVFTAMAIRVKEDGKNQVEFR